MTTDKLAELLGPKRAVYTWHTPQTLFWQGTEATLGAILDAHADRVVEIAFDKPENTDDAFTWCDPNIHMVRLSLFAGEVPDFPPGVDRAEYDTVVVLIQDAHQVLAGRIRTLTESGVLDSTPRLADLAHQVEHGPGVFYTADGTRSYAAKAPGMLVAPPQLPGLYPWKVTARYAGQATDESDFYRTQEDVEVGVAELHDTGWHHVTVYEWVGEQFAGTWEVVRFSTRAPRVGDRIVGFTDGRQYAGLVTIVTTDGYGKTVYRIITGDPDQHTDSLVTFVEFDATAVPGRDYDPAALDLREPAATAQEQM